MAPNAKNFDQPDSECHFKTIQVCKMEMNKFKQKSCQGVSSCEWKFYMCASS